MKPVITIRRIAQTLLFIAGACTTCFSLSNARTIEQFTHTSWGEKEGAPRRIWAIAQTKDGYLWLASSEGVVRFDGVTFEHYVPLTGPAFPSLTSHSLLALPNGDLWIGFDGGTVSLLRNGSARIWTSRDGIPEEGVSSLACDREGTVWAGTSIGLAKLEGNRWKEVGKEWNFNEKSVHALFVDHQGTLWVAADNTIVFLPRGSKSFQSTSVLVGQVPQLIEAHNGKLWMAETTRSVRPVPLGAEPAPANPVEIRVGSQGIFFAREGDLWITTLGDGLRRVPAPEQLRGKVGRFDSGVEKFTTKNGLTDNIALSAFQDRDGAIWIGTLSGLDRFRMGGLVPVPMTEYNPVPNPILAPGKNGDLWAAIGGRLFHISESGADDMEDPGHQIGFSEYSDSRGVMWWISREAVLVRFAGERLSQFPLPREISKTFTDLARTSFVLATEDPGIIWMAVEQQGLFRFEKGAWTRIDTSPEPSKVMPTAAFTDDLGRAWFGYRQGTIFYLYGGKTHVVSTRENHRVAGVSVIEGRKQHVWVGGYSGLALFDEGQFHQLAPLDRPAFERVSEIKELADGSLWLCERRGLTHIPASEVHKFLETPAYRVHYRVFDSLDGLPGKLQGAGQKLVEGTDGRIWVGADHGIAWLSPSKIPASAPPPISIRSVVASGRRFTAQPDLALPPRSENLRIEFTAVNLSAPERVRARYKLDGIDQEWQDAGVSHEAFYTNLGPGKYRFRMNARNEGEDWNLEEAVLDFSVAPAWSQTIWFRASCGCAFVLLLWLLYQLRLRQLQRQFNRTLETRVSERTRIARELHDTLLQSFSALLLPLQSASNLIPARPDEAQQRVESAIEQASHAITEGRDAVHQLRSGELLTPDLAGSISNFFAELPEGPGNERRPPLRVQIEGTPRDIRPLVRDEIFRIAAEALRNAARYAEAGHIEVEIRYDAQQLRLRIRDDGRGIEPDVLDQGPAPGHWGLRGMRERARVVGGKFEVWSEPGSGTEVELTIPAVSAYIKPASRWSILLRGWRS